MDKPSADLFFCGHHREDFGKGVPSVCPRPRALPCKFRRPTDVQSGFFILLPYDMCSLNININYGRLLGYVGVMHGY
jgi:hypothetical protein